MSLPIEELKALANSYNFYTSFFREKPSRDWFKSAIDFLQTWRSETEGDSGALSDVDQAHDVLVDKVKQDGLSMYTTFLQQEYERLFFAPGRVLVNLYESVYRGNGLLMQDVTVDVRQHYLRAGLVVKALYSIPDDHLATELEFMEFLTKQQLEQFESGSPTVENHKLESWRDEFMKEHLKPWIPTLAENIRMNTSDPFFRLMSLGLAALVEEE